MIAAQLIQDIVAKQDGISLSTVIRDNGPELISLTLPQSAEEHGVMLEFIRPGKPTQNAFFQRFNRTYRTEIPHFYLFRMLCKAREITERWLAKDNVDRPHESVNNLTPEEYLLMAENPGIAKSAGNSKEYAYNIQPDEKTFVFSPNVNATNGRSGSHSDGRHGTQQSERQA